MEERDFRNINVSHTRKVESTTCIMGKKNNDWINMILVSPTCLVAVK